MRPPGQRRAGRRVGAVLSESVEAEQQKVRASSEKSVKESASDMAGLRASGGRRASWEEDVAVRSDFPGRAQRNPNVLFVIYGDAQGQQLTR